jgi:signal transduction histidine kinase
MRARVLPVLIVALGLVLVACIFVFQQAYRTRLREVREMTAQRAAGLVHSELDHATALMGAALEAIAEDEVLAASMEAGDRARLLADGAPLFAALRDRYKVEHFYFHRVDKTNLLRLHEPDHSDDKISRVTLADAERTGEVTSGIEQGPTGNCTLRVVRPWRRGDQLLGYLELGTEFTTVAQRVQKLMKVDLVFVVEKANLDRKRWENRNKLLGRQTAWEDYPGVVVIDTTVSSIPAALNHTLATGVGPSGELLITEGDRTVQVVVQPLPGVRGGSLGSIIVLSDITAISAEAQRSIVLVAGACVAVGGVLSLFFYVFLGRVGRDLHNRAVRLAEANATLEKRVDERTSELRAAQEKLVEAARGAGMAEVAAGVLHNVGNVLNSVNVAANVAATTLRGSEVSNLARARDMLREHSGDLAAFLTKDERGRHLPGYLIALAGQLADEQVTVLKELEAVEKGVDHIKRVIDTQQDNARQGALIEAVTPGELVAAALRMEGGGKGVEVEQRIEASARVLLDKHRVLQVLVNLIRNAFEAVERETVCPKRVTVSATAVTEGGRGRVRFEVADNGVGIATENLTKIFVHGFTTRAGGHGFGLHSSANAAQTMGGSLTASSDGPGRGARFVLSLPVAEEAVEAAAGTGVVSVG